LLVAVLQKVTAYKNQILNIKPCAEFEIWRDKGRIGWQDDSASKKQEARTC
jgi:hypothetical protein